VFEQPRAELTFGLVEQRTDGVQRRPVGLDALETFEEG